MKKKYTGLSTFRIAVECQPLMQASNQKLKAKTKVKDWEKENVDVEMGMTDINVSSLQ